MKKLMFLLATVVLMACTATVVQAQRIPVTVIKKGTKSIDSVQYHLNPAGIQYVVASGANSQVGYTDYMYRNALVVYTVTDKLDSIYNRANKYTPTLVKVTVSTLVPNTFYDTLKVWAFPLAKLGESKAVTVANQETAKTQLYIEQSGTQKPYYLNETTTRLASIVDSLYAQKTGGSSYKYDTANYTLKTFDKHIVLKSTTDDTLTLLNPSLFVDQEPITISNIGSGAYTIAGGFTVKDKSDSTVSTIAANTVYQFKAYYNGSAFIWLRQEP